MSDKQFIAGGAGQNTARAVQFMSPTPNLVHYIGSIGEDDNGKTLQSEASKAGVATHYYISKVFVVFGCTSHLQENPTGCVAVLVSKAERTLVARLGAANDYKHSHFESEEIQSLLPQIGALYAASFFLTVSPDTLVALGKHCAAENKLFFLNIAAPFLVEFFWDKMEAVLPFTDFVIGNETEAAAITEKLGGDPKDIKAGLKLVADLPKVNSARPRTVVFTQNELPVLIYRDGEYLEFPVEAVPEDQIVDKNGAGDSFCGGFVAALLHGCDLRTAVDAGHWLASRVIQVSGAQFPAKNEFSWE